MYTGCLYLLIDGDKISGEVAPNKGLKQGCPLSPLLYSLYTNDIDRFLTVQRGAATALDSVQVPHCDYADDIALTSNTAECLQFQLNKFHNYTRFKGLKLNTDKTKIMVFFSKDTSAIPTFTYDGTPLELVTHFKYLGFTLTRDGSMHTAAEKMADNLRLAIARVYRTGSSKGITHRKHAMLWLFQVFALTAGLYGCQVWATFSLTYDSSVTTRAHVLHLGFLKKLLGVKKGTDTHCVLRETGQMPIFFYWFRCTIRFWNSLLSSNNPLLEKIVRADLLLANRRDTWTYQVLHALQDLPTSQQFLDAIQSRQTINQRQFELTLREHIIGGWRDLDIFFLGWCYSYGPQQGPDRQQKKRGETAQAEEKAKGSCSRRPRTKERKPGKRKKNQVEYRVEGAQDRRRRRKPGGWKETPNTRKRGGDAQSCSC